MHSLIHLCDDIQQHGSVQNAYKYENNAGKIKSSIRHAKNVSQQIYNRTLEHFRTLTIPENCVSIQMKRKILIDEQVFYQQIILKDLRFDTTERNKWFSTTKKEICSLRYAQEVNEQVKVTCGKINQPLGSFFDYPLSSMELDIYFANNFLNQTDQITIDVEDIGLKLFAIPFLDGYVFFSMSNNYVS